MKLSLANEVRSLIISKLLGFMSDSGEDVAMVSSNTFNFPYVLDGEECFVEVTAKVVKKDSDECYQEREDYVNHIAEKAEKKAEADKKKAEKIAKDAAKRKEKEDAKKKKEEGE